MPHNLLMFFLPDSTAFLIAENLFFHHSGWILLDDLIESLKIGHLVLEVLVLLPEGLVLLLQILRTYFPWHYLFRDDLYACCGICCSRPLTISIILCQNLVFVAADVIDRGMSRCKCPGRLFDRLALLFVPNNLYLLFKRVMFPHLFLSFRYLLLPRRKFCVT